MYLFHVDARLCGQGFAACRRHRCCICCFVPVEKPLVNVVLFQPSALRTLHSLNQNRLRIPKHLDLKEV